MTFEKLFLTKLDNKQKRLMIAGSAVIVLALLALIFSRSAGSQSNYDIKLTAFSEAGQVKLAWTTTISGLQEYKVYRSDQPGVAALPEHQLATVTGTVFNDTGVTAEKTYYYLVTAGLNGREYQSNQTAGVAFLVNPHGNYKSNTLACGQCHQNHTGAGPQLLTGTGIAGTCYACHDGGKAGKNDIKEEFARTGSGHLKYPGGNSNEMTCSSCHNPHDGGKDGAGKQIRLPKLLQVRQNGQTMYSGGGEEFCFTCHADKKSFYPAEGNGHNSMILQGESGISCLSCHERHGSELPRLLKVYPKGGELKVTGLNSSACLTCHRQSLGSSMDNAWDGEKAYSDSSSKNNCSVCHDVHGTANDRNLPAGVNSKYLRYSYDVNYSSARNKPFSEQDFNSCLRSGCHTGADLLGSDTNFKDATSGVNLHQLHLRMNNNGYGNATCKECHRPHGAIESENPSLRARVGFPAKTVTPLIGLAGVSQPVYSSATPGEGSCSLGCHGVNHVAGEAESGEVNSSYSQVKKVVPPPELKPETEMKQPAAGGKEAGGFDDGDGEGKVNANLEHDE